MRVLIQSMNFTPELTGIGKYSGELADWFVSQGHEVRVICAPPYYPAWRIDKPYHGWWYEKYNHNSVEIIRCPLYVPKQPGFLKRIMHLMSFAVNSLPVALVQGLFWRPNLVIVVEPPVMTAPGAWLCARLSGARSWLHIQDFEIDAAFDLGIAKAIWAKKVLYTMESWLIRRFDKVSTISNKMLQRLEQKGVIEDRRELLPNWVDTDMIRPIAVKNQMRSKLGLQDEQIVLLYSGNMGEKQGLDIVIEAAKRLAFNRRIQFVLCGDGAVKNRIQKMAEGLSNVRFIPLQPLSAFNETMNLADIHLLPQRADVEDLVMPSKLTSMLASGKPVIATVRPGTEIAGIIEHAGVITAPGDVEQLVEAITALAIHSDWRLMLGINARNIAECDLNRDRILRKVFQHYVSPSQPVSGVVLSRPQPEGVS